jgi:uncharacterized membrane protein YeaQ/YmgE (transglycosylase-associated protein family)
MDRVGLASWIVIGFLAGAIARRVTDQRPGRRAEIAVGAIGALIGGTLARAAGLGGIDHFGLRFPRVAAVDVIGFELAPGAVAPRR